jgi:hypothetical protein
MCVYVEMICHLEKKRHCIQKLLIKLVRGTTLLEICPKAGRMVGAGLSLDMPAALKPMCDAAML